MNWFHNHFEVSVWKFGFQGYRYRHDVQRASYIDLFVFSYVYMQPSCMNEQLAQPWVSCQSM